MLKLQKTRHRLRFHQKEQGAIPGNLPYIPYKRFRGPYTHVALLHTIELGTEGNNFQSNRP